jgi:hypothetical protein
MNQWYCKLDGVAAGPFSRDELDYLAGRGQLAADTLVRLEDQSGWSRAAELLSDLFPAAAPMAAAVAVADPPPQATAISVAAPARPQQPVSKDDPESKRRRKQVLLGTGIGIATALLIFLLLLLLLTFGGWGKGRGLAGAGGLGGGDGTGAGSGTGPGSGSGSGGGAGSGMGGGVGGGSQSSTDGQSGPAGGAKKSGVGSGSGKSPPAESGDQRGPARGDADEADLKVTPPFAIQKFTAPPVATSGGAPAGSGDGSFLSGGGGGGGSDGSEFFGTRARGSKFVYIIDCSSSMSGAKFDKAKAELIASIKRLKSTHSTFVYFFSSDSYPMFEPDGQAETKLLKCTKENVARIEQWILDFPCRGGTMPRQSLLDALDLKADAIFFLTDGGFDPTVADDVRTKNHSGEGKPTSINTICFTDKTGEPVMEKIAKENKGDYRFVP